MYLWPPAQIFDFALGVVAAEVAATRASRPRWRHAGAPLPRGKEDFHDATRRDATRRSQAAADATFFCAAGAVLFVPNAALAYRTGWEELFDHALAPVFAVFLYCAAIDGAAGQGGGGGGGGGPSSAAATALAHAAPRSLGAASFEVYLFQWPLHAIFAFGLGLDTKEGAENFVAYVLALYAAAAAYEARVERPYVAWLRAKFPPPLDARTASSASLAAL